MGDPEPAPTRAGSVWILRDSSGCPNQPKHLSATRGLENHGVSEDREEHQALLQSCGFSVFHIYWSKEESLVKAGSPAAGSSTATAGWLVPVLISPSTGSALPGAPPGHVFLVQRLLQPRISNDRVSVGRIFLCCLILPPSFCGRESRKQSTACSSAVSAGRRCSELPLPWAGSII